jgi:hypothetical protein
MKLSPVRLIAALCCLLLAGQGIMAQEVTAPLPPPDVGTTTPSPPVKGAIVPTATPSPKTPASGGLKLPFFGAKPAEEKPAAAPKAPAAESPAAVSKTPAAESPAAAPKTPAAGSPAAAPKVPAEEKPAATPKAPAAAQSGSAARTSGAAGANPAASSWEKKGAYAGFQLGMSLPSHEVHNMGSLNIDEDNFDSSTSFQLGLLLGYHFGKLGVQLEAQLAFDEVKYEGFDDNGKVTGTSLLIPLIFKYDLNSGPFVFQPLIGLYYNGALGKLNADFDSGSGSAAWANAPIGGMFGAAFGWKSKKGMLFVDARAAIDMGSSVYAGNGEQHYLWWKSAFILSLGYEFN